MPFLESTREEEGSEDVSSPSPCLMAEGCRLPLDLGAEVLQGGEHLPHLLLHFGASETDSKTPRHAKGCSDWGSPQ